MPLDGSNNYYYPPGTPGIPDQTIESEKYNTFLDDLVNNDLNIPRPVHRGGTGANNATTALINLIGEKATQLVTNFNSHVWLPGSFYASNATGQGAPVNGHAFAGICYLNEPLANPPTNNNLVVEARDQNDTAIPGRVWVREKKAGVWSAWIEQVGGAVEVVNILDIRYVNLTGDTISGPIVINNTLNAGATNVYTLTAAGAVKGDHLWATNAQGVVYFTAAGTAYIQWRPDLGNVLWASHSWYQVVSANSVQAGTSLHAGTSLNVGTTIVAGGQISTSSNVYASGTVTGTNVTASGGTVSGTYGSITNYLTVGTNLSVGGNANVSGRVDATGLIVTQSGFESPAHLYVSGSATCTNFYCASPGNHWTTSSGGSLTVGWAGYQPGGGLWGDSSDARIKTVQGDYTHGLTEIKQLLPRRYKFNGNDLMLGTGGVAGLKSPKVSDPGVSSHGAVLEKEFVGLVAQECEAIMPEMVTLSVGVIDGQLVDDMRILNASALTYALVNAVKELATRVEQLESAV